MDVASAVGHSFPAAALACGVLGAIAYVRVRSSHYVPAQTSASTDNAQRANVTLVTPRGRTLVREARPKHALLTNAVPQDMLDKAFQEGVLKCYHEQQLPSYSRYEKWTQSCYMEIHDKWTPRPPVNAALLASMKEIQDTCRQVFAAWYSELYSLEACEVITLNSFVTKYVPSEGKNEFGKHVDGVKVEGSLVLALPTDDPNDWPGMIVWDGPKGRGPKGVEPNRPEHRYEMQPGDALCMDRLVWHHGLPITTGTRYVAVNFYAIKWRGLKGTKGL